MPVSAVRAIRGAIQLDVDEREHVLSSTRELVSSVLAANSLTKDDVISIMFTATRTCAASSRQWRRASWAWVTSR